MRDYVKVARFDWYIKKEILIKILLSLCVTGTYVLQAILLARGTACVFAAEDWRKPVFCYLTAALLIILRALIVRYLEGYTKLAAGRIKTVLRELIIEKLLLLGPGYQADKRSGKMQSLVTDGVEYLEPFLVNYIPQIFVVIFSVVPMVIYICSLNKTAGFLLIAAVLFSVFAPLFMMHFTSRASIGYWKEYAVLNSQYVDTMQGMNTLKFFGADARKGKELAEDSEEFRRRQILNTRNSLFSSAAIVLMSAAGTSITTGAAAYSCANGYLEYSSLLTIMFLVIECIRPIGELNHAWHASYLGLSVTSEFADIMDEPVMIRNLPQADHSSLEKDLPEISFENVTFRYNDKRETALDHVSFHIHAGQTVAFAGASGSGKSTIVNLLLRFYDAGSGVIRINGKDIREYDLSYLRSKISVVFQNTYLFYGTVKENIRMARPDASDEEVYCAAKAANAHEFILELEKGYDTLVGERGTTLSGGQRQRIAIARAILKNAPVLIMDEATSSVDAATEKTIQKTVEGIQGKYTTILIAHRLSTIQHAEKIYVLQQGILQEEGRHEELLKKGGVYQKLVEAQNGGAEWRCQKQ